MADFGEAIAVMIRDQSFEMGPFGDRQREAFDGFINGELEFEEAARIYFLCEVRIHDIKQPFMNLLKAVGEFHEQQKKLKED